MFANISACLWIVTYAAVRPIGFYPFANDYGYPLRISIAGFDLFARGDGR
jgi:hypothetical protein